MTAEPWYPIPPEPLEEPGCGCGGLCDCNDPGEDESASAIRRADAFVRMADHWLPHLVGGAAERSEQASRAGRQAREDVVLAEENEPATSERPGSRQQEVGS